MAITPADMLTEVRRLLDQRFPTGDLFSDRYTDADIQLSLGRALPRLQGQLAGRFGASMTETLVLGATGAGGVLTLPRPSLKVVSVSARTNGQTWRLRALPPGQGRLVSNVGIPGFEVRWIPHWIAPATDGAAYDFTALQAWELTLGAQLATLAALDLVTITGSVPEGLVLHASRLETDLAALPLRQSYRSLTLPLVFPDPQTWDAAYWATSPTEVLVWFTC